MTSTTLVAQVQVGRVLETFASAKEAREAQHKYAGMLTGYGMGKSHCIGVRQVPPVAGNPGRAFAVCFLVREDISEYRQGQGTPRQS